MARGKKVAHSDKHEEAVSSKKENTNVISQSSRVTRSMEEVIHFPPLPSPSGMKNSSGNQATKQSGAGSPASSFANVVNNQTDSLDVSDHDVPTSNNIKVTLDDIADEVDYWKNSVICHILGGNPPLSVFQNFVTRIWNAMDVDKIAVLAKGFFIVRFTNMDAKTKAIEGGIPTFDKKPVVLTPWTPDFDVTKADDRFVPIWVRLPGLPLKYWGKSVLTMITSQLGKPLRIDNATAAKERLHFARVLVKMDIQRTFPPEIAFQNEHDSLVSYRVEYEWKPIKCTKCNMFGHLEEQCKLEERMQLVCGYCNLHGHTKEQCKRKGKAPTKNGKNELPVQKRNEEAKVTDCGTNKEREEGNQILQGKVLEGTSKDSLLEPGDTMRNAGHGESEERDQGDDQPPMSSCVQPVLSING